MVYMVYDIVSISTLYLVPYIFNIPGIETLEVEVVYIVQLTTTTTSYNYW